MKHWLIIPLLFASSYMFMNYSEVKTVASVSSPSPAQKKPANQKKITTKVTQQAKNSVTITFTNRTKDTYLCDMSYRIQQLKKGKWQNVTPQKDVAWREVARILDSGETYTEEVKNGRIYGYPKLGKGTYRLEKTFYKDESSVKVFATFKLT